MSTTNQQSFLTNSSLLLISKGLERAGFYGLRSIIIIHLIGEVVNLERSEAISYMSILTVVVSVSMILGGILGDLVLTNRIATFTGSILQIMGAIICCLPNHIAIIIGLMLVGLGAGVYNGNLFAVFAKLYRPNDKLMDSGFTIYYMANNLGAIIGFGLVALLFEIHYLIGIFSCALLFTGAFLLVKSSNSQEVEVVTPSTSPTISAKTTTVLIVFLLSAIFWVVYDFGSDNTFEASNRVATASTGFFSFNILLALSSIFTIVFGIIAAVLWKYVCITRPIKVGLGFMAAAVSFILLYLMNDTESSILSIYIIAIAIFGIAETLLAPTLFSLITRYANPKYLAITISLYDLPYRLIAYLSGLFLFSILNEDSMGLFIGIICFSITAIFVFLFRDKFRNIEDTSTSSEIDEIGVKNTNL